MSLPQPRVALDDICSVIHHNTLYTWSPNAFQALELGPGGNWTTLPQGVKVKGAVCVGSTPKDPQAAGFYVVGGEGPDANYQGLQKFTYATQKWENITLPEKAAVTQQRRWHGAVYLPGSDHILIYAGSQDGVERPSSDSFTISASAPFEVRAIPSTAPPLIKPMLLPWSDMEAILVGGSTTNKQVFLFREDIDWVDSGASLAEPLEKDITAMKAALVTGDDQSKNLYVFDMTQSPNTVTRTVLVNGDQKPIQNSPRIATRAEGEGGEWPQYNATLAPKATRSNYALAQDLDGMVVIAGGNNDDILCAFDGRENQWLNATAMLVNERVFAASASSTSLSSTTSATPSSTSLTLSTATTTPTGVAAPIGNPDDSSALPTNILLGIILGSVFGAAIVLSLIYLCIRRKRSHQAYLEAGHMRRASGISSPEKDSIIFANDSITRGPSGAGVFRGHQQQQSGNSFSSMAILMGKVNKDNHEHPPGAAGGINRNPSNQTKRSSSSSIFNKAFKSTISKPIPQMAETVVHAAPPRRAPESSFRDEKQGGAEFASNTNTTGGSRNLTGNAAGGAGGDNKRDSTRRSSGWNRYWSGGSALNLLGFGSGNAAAAAQQNNANKRTTVESDRSSQYSNVSSANRRTTQDSATVPPLNVYEPRASFSRVTRGSPTIVPQYGGREVMKEGQSGRIERPVSGAASEAYSSGVPESVHEAWDPMTMQQKAWGADRAPSSAYTSYTAAPSAPSAAAQQQRQQNPLPTGVSRQPVLAQAATSDMSWLNLGDNNGH